MAGLEGEERRNLVKSTKYVKSMHEIVKEEPVFPSALTLCPGLLEANAVT